MMFFLKRKKRSKQTPKLLVVNVSKSTHLVKAPVICAIACFLNIVRNCSYSFSILHSVIFHNSFERCLYLSV